MKTKIYQLDADKLVPAPVNLSKISDVAKAMLLKRMYRILRGNISRKIPGITNLDTTAALNPKTNEIKGETPNINEPRNKITNLVHDKYITTPEFTKLIAENFAARFEQVNLVSKRDIAYFFKKTDFDNKLKYVTSKK